MRFENTPYYSYSQYLQNRFGSKVYKVVLSGGMTCPTRDGTISSNSCAFCDLRGSSSFHGKKGRGDEIHDQITKRIPAIRKRFGAAKILGYFQSYTNTYDKVERLEKLYSSTLSHPEISGLCIGTRPDCLPDEVLHLLESLAKQHYISLELGIQSFHNPTLEWLERGHTAEQSLEALDRLQKLAPSVEVCTHLMFGAPTEPEAVALEAAQILSRYKISGVKLHQLMVLENTGLADRYREKPFSLLSREKYLQLVSDFLSALRKDIYIERLYALATHPEECLGPDWSTERWKTHNFFKQALLLSASQHEISTFKNI